jgi:hypothetical protein
VSGINDYVKFVWKSAKRAPLRWRLRGVVSWQPMRVPLPGYTVVIAAMRRLWPVAAANLKLISEMRTTSMREIIVVFDGETREIPEEIRRLVAELDDRGIRIRLLGYSPEQARVAHSIQWGWVYSWLSWSVGIGAATTRRVLLHDLDALPIDADLFDRLFTAAEKADAQFFGIRHYAGNGVHSGMNLVTTFEMVLDASWLRENVNPFEGFNQVRLVDGHYVDFDTWLDVQRRAPNRAVEPIAETSLIHPSQLICQFTDHLAGRGGRTSSTNRLPILAYFMHLGDPTFELGDLAVAVADPRIRTASLWGRESDIGSIPAETWAWMEKQIRRLEQHLFGATRPGIENLLIGFKRRAGERRTVGVEPVEEGGVEDR